jgi:hypothetical protein
MGKKKTKTGAENDSAERNLARGRLIGPVVPAAEAEGEEPKPKSFYVTVIASGWADTETYYSAEVLKAAVAEGVFEKIGTEGVVRSFLDHMEPGQHYRKMEKLAAKVSDIHFDDASESVKAKWTPVGKEKAWLVELAEAEPDLVGLSIWGLNEGGYGTAEGRRGFIVARVATVTAIDTVAVPAAGGGVERPAAEAAGTAAEGELEDRIKAEELEREFWNVKYALDDMIREALQGDVSVEEIDEALDEYKAKVLELVNKSKAPETEEGESMTEEEKKKLETLEAENETLKAAEAKREAGTKVEEALATEANADLPDAAKKRVLAAFEACEDPIQFDVAAAVKLEREYLATLAAESEAEGDGGPVGTGAAGDGTDAEAAENAHLKRMAESVFDTGSDAEAAQPADGSGTEAPDKEEGK